MRQLALHRELPRCRVDLLVPRHAWSILPSIDRVVAGHARHTNRRVGSELFGDDVDDSDVE